MSNNLTRLSKLLSYVLRHNPAHLNLQLDEQGWVSVNELLHQLNNHNEPVTFELLKEIVDTNSKKRFSFNEDFTRIRANQGHSLEIDLNYMPQQPPDLLYHGTAAKNLEAILQQGLNKISRHHVHLSADTSSALQVGSRHGKPIVLIIRAMEMHQQGHVFYCSQNGVWLTDHVPPSFISCHQLK
jgi:putative RNA 2'-phosphotransferase